MKEIGPIVGIDHKNTTKMTIKERIIVISRTREIAENIKIIIKINIGINCEISMIVIILIVEIDHMTGMIHIVEIDRETITKVTIKVTTEMIIEMKIIENGGIREGLEIIMKMPIMTGTVGINIDTNTGMTAMTEIEVGLVKEVACLRQGKLLPG